MQPGLDAETDVSTEVAECEHDTLGETCRTGCIVNLGERALVDIRIVDIRTGESVGIQFAHPFGQFPYIFLGYM